LAGGRLIARDGLIVAMVEHDEPALVEAGRRFVAWTRRYVPTFRPASPPNVWAGDVLLTTEAG
jgi:hypothetical protein